MAGNAAQTAVYISRSKEEFYRYVQLQVTSIEEQIDQLQNLGLSGGERQDAIDHILASISRLSSEIADASDTIPAYDQRTYAQVIRALHDKLASTRERVVPKPKFAFRKTNKNNSAISLSDAATLAAEQRTRLPAGPATTLPSSNESSMATTPAPLMTPPSERLERTDVVNDLPSFGLSKDYDAEMEQLQGRGVRKPSFSQASNIKISGHDRLHIILPSSAARATASGQVLKLSKCVLDMSVPTIHGAPFAGLNIKTVVGSLVVAGQVAGATHVTGMQSSVLVVTSRQLRMHECRNVDVYLMCSSRPIIEDCSGIRFAPIPRHHMPILDAPAKNMWDQVDDFKWLKHEHSPNWCVLPEEKRVSDETWEQVVPGGPLLGVDDVLKRVGIRD